MSSLEDLYKEVILDHYRSPRNKGELETPPAHKAEGFNPLCGDEIQVYLLIENNIVKDIKIGGQGCSISQSSASMMTAAIHGKTITEAEKYIQDFKAMMAIHETEIGGDGSEADSQTEAGASTLGDLEALRGVVKFPVRIKCAVLSWNTLKQGLEEVKASSKS